MEYFNSCLKVTSLKSIPKNNLEIPNMPYTNKPNRADLIPFLSFVFGCNTSCDGGGCSNGY
ncbi:hypothetical protein BpHYR1_041131 [Brachionus plicatilis]|uniref:Uncharacterized protein n=1 Tax=Brachionus plicatilis TaxID=10195 RepID=A0A3M7S3S6_BRAPC|nr:hypothetical protein BpHYR1_041131 [Brachionus plicatilis]